MIARRFTPAGFPSWSNSMRQRAFVRQHLSALMRRRRASDRSCSTVCRRILLGTVIVGRVGWADQSRQSPTTSRTRPRFCACGPSQRAGRHSARSAPGRLPTASTDTGLDAVDVTSPDEVRTLSVVKWPAVSQRQCLYCIGEAFDQLRPAPAHPSASLGDSLLSWSNRGHRHRSGLHRVSKMSLSTLDSYPSTWGEPLASCHGKKGEG